MQTPQARPLIAFGPQTPGWGSWDWVGRDVMDALSEHYRTVCYGWDAVPACDVLFIIKHPLPAAAIEAASRRSAVIYCPVDHYGSASEIDDDGPMLRRCSRVVVHCQRLRKYFEPYAPVEYLDHHVKFVAGSPQPYRQEGFVLWVGVRTNLPYLVQWLNKHPLPHELRVLTNLEDPSRLPSPGELGFQEPNTVRVQHWTPELHLELLGQARGALDVKGDDFRQSHKPPAKAIDFIASGIPLAMNPQSSSVEHLRRMGFRLPSPLDSATWFSQEYWSQTRRFGQALREILSLERVAVRYMHLIATVWESQNKERRE